MITDFSERFMDIVNQIEFNLPDAFEKKRMVDYHGRIAALSASYAISEEKKWLGIMPTGRSTHCHEFRLVYAVKSLTNNELIDWWDFLCNQQKTLIPVDDFHEFSLVSLILVCGEVDEDIIRNIKKLDNQINYNKSGESGWSTAQMVAMDLEKHKIYISKTGDMLRSSLKNIKF